MTGRGDQLPDFAGTQVDGGFFEYSSIWQRRNLVLVTLSPDSAGEDREYIVRLAARERDFDALNTRCVVTRERVADVPAPAVIVADRWGEIVHVAAAPHARDLPSADELLEWVEYVERRCPECEGEAK